MSTLLTGGSYDAGVTEAPRDAIARVAGRRFAEQGFTATSVRAIAAEAGVDPALVIRHFGSKEALFLDTARIEGVFRDVLVPPVGTLGVRLVASVVEGADDRVRGTYAALLWASSSPDVRARLAEVSTRELVRPLAALLDGPDADLRAALAAAQVDGLMRAAWVTAVPGVVDRPADVVRVYGAAVQALLDGGAAASGRLRRRT